MTTDKKSLGQEVILSRTDVPRQRWFESKGCLVVPRSGEPQQFDVKVPVRQWSSLQ